jgi:hypothetical protein
MDRQRPGRQKARPRCRQSEKESSILRICLESIGPTDDSTVSDGGAGARMTVI